MSRFGYFDGIFVTIFIGVLMKRLNDNLLAFEFLGRLIGEIFGINLKLMEVNFIDFGLFESRKRIDFRDGTL
jgi:hypothetical protein